MPGWTEEGGGRFTADPGDIGDAILARKDAPASYHLACVTDDAASGVTLVVRGADLRPSTPIQRLLQMLLGLPEPVYCHHPLVTHTDGRRLAKRDLAPTLAAMRGAGVDGRTLAAQLLASTLPLGFSFRLVSLCRRRRARGMSTVMIILLVAAMAATAYVLVRGVIAMASGKDVTGEQQQAWMRKRVLFQAVAIVLVALILIMASASGG
jgi:hypothetical protein